MEPTISAPRDNTGEARRTPAVGERRRKISPGRHARLRVAVFTRDGFTCQDCGKHIPSSPDFDGRYAPYLDGDWLELDHITPRIAGGEDTAENMRALCSTCNRRKSASMRYADWPARIGRAQAILAARQPNKAAALAAVAALLGED